MDGKAEFPDEELATSPIVGGVFRIPTQIPEEGSDSDYDDRRPTHTSIRPHSAKGTTDCRSSKLKNKSSLPCYDISYRK